jgi:hypothetical protein
VLVHQPNPTLMVRRAATAVRPGGIVAFMEPALHVHFETIPDLELLQSATECVMRFQRIALPNHDIAGRIIPCFIDAGLPEPHVLWESIVPGSDRTYLRWLVATYETLLPLMERFGVVNSAVGDPATLYDRINVAVTAARAQGLTPRMSAHGRNGIEYLSGTARSLRTSTNQSRRRACPHHNNEGRVRRDRQRRKAASTTASAMGFP